MDVAFLEDGGIEFIISRDGITMRFRIANPFKYGIDSWRFIRNGGMSSTRYDGCKMSSTPANMSLIFYEDSQIGTYQIVRLKEGFLELSIELELSNKSRFAKSSIRVPLVDCYNCIDKLIEQFESV